MKHEIVYEKGLEAVCACGAYFSIYGSTSSIAMKFAEHVRIAVAEEALPAIPTVSPRPVPPGTRFDSERIEPNPGSPARPEWWWTPEGREATVLEERRMAAQALTFQLLLALNEKTWTPQWGRDDWRLWLRETLERIETGEIVVEGNVHRRWGVAHDVRPNGFVNPSAVEYAASRAGAIRKAQIAGGKPVTSVASNWVAIEPDEEEKR